MSKPWWKGIRIYRTEGGLKWYRYLFAALINLVEAGINILLLPFRRHVSIVFPYAIWLWKTRKEKAVWHVPHDKRENDPC